VSGRLLGFLEIITGPDDAATDDDPQRVPACRPFVSYEYDVHISSCLTASICRSKDRVVPSPAASRDRGYLTTRLLTLPVECSSAEYGLRPGLRFASVAGATAEYGPLWTPLLRRSGPAYGTAAVAASTGFAALTF
jgi:hypothetical protein